MMMMMMMMMIIIIIIIIKVDLITRNPYLQRRELICKILA
jgi:hypothetical protein